MYAARFLGLGGVYAFAVVTLLVALPAVASREIFRASSARYSHLRGQPTGQARPLLMCLRGGGGAVEAEESFRSLMAISGCSSVLRLREGQRGRGLFTAGAIAEGDELLTVPLSACLVEHRAISDAEAERQLGRRLSEGQSRVSFLLHLPRLVLFGFASKYRNAKCIAMQFRIQPPSPGM